MTDAFAILGARVMCALLLAGGAVAGNAPLSDLRLEGSTELEPGEFTEYNVSWDGGEPPWSVTFDASEPGFDRRQEQTVPSVFACFGSVAGSCALAPVPVSFSKPQIATVTALVRDAAGASIARQLRVRVGTDGPLFIDPGPTADVRPDPNDAQRFLCRGSSPDQPRLIPIVEGEIPLIDFHDDARLTAPDRLAVVGRDACGRPQGVLYGIADADLELGTFPPPETELSLEFPYRFGDYSRPDTRPDRDPSIPSPPLRPMDSYEVQVPLPLECNDAFFTVFQSFSLNPPNGGDAAVGSIEQSDCFNDEVPVERTQRLETGVRYASGQSGFVSCVNDTFFHGFLVRLEALRVSLAFDDEDIDERKQQLIFELFGNPERIDRVRQRCAEATGIANKGVSPVELGVDLVDGRARVTVPAEAVTLSLRTEQVTVQAETGFEFQVDHVPGGITTVAAIGEPLTVMPRDEASSARVVEPGFFVIVDAGTVSEPRRDEVFADGLEGTGQR